jgi:hypothetical protein
VILATDQELVDEKGVMSWVYDPSTEWPKNGAAQKALHDKAEKECMVTMNVSIPPPSPPSC